MERDEKEAQAPFGCHNNCCHIYPFVFLFFFSFLLDFTEKIVASFLQLLPECSPQSVAYILELLALRHCAGCHFFRAESRGQSWDTKGNHVKDVRLELCFLVSCFFLSLHFYIMYWSRLVLMLLFANPSIPLKLKVYYVSFTDIGWIHISSSWCFICQHHMVPYHLTTNACIHIRLH